MRLRRLTVFALGILFLVVNLLTLFVHPPQAQAAGETFTWISADQIKACGGDYPSECVTYKQGPNPIPGGHQQFYLTNNMQYRGCVLYAGGGGFDATYIDLNPDGRTGTAEFHQIQFTNNGGRPGECPYPTNFPDVSVTMANARPGSTNQYRLNVNFITSVQPAPPTLEGAVKQGHNQQISAPSIITANSPSHPVPGSVNTGYAWSFFLQLGDYTFCVQVGTPACYNTTVGANGAILNIGESDVGRTVNVRAGNSITGVYETVIKSEDGTKEIARDKTGPNTLVVPIIRSVKIPNIDPGKYQACLSGVSGDQCVPFEKRVNQSVNVLIGTDDVPNTDETIAPQLRCESSIFNPLTWLFCPMIAAAQGAVNALSGAIDELLVVETDPIFNQSTDTGRAFYQTWTSFRNLALGLIVVVGLVMVISQAAGLELLSAYTIRKVLPRLVIATIFITLSWPVLEFLITLTNQVGIGIRSLIYAPFKGLAQEGIGLDNSQLLVSAIIGAPVIMALGLLALLSFVISIFVSVIMGFLALFLREAVIMFLVIISPIAIACSILPNTQGVWTVWRTTLITLLVLFPIITGFIAICRVFALVFYNA